MKRLNFWIDILEILGGAKPVPSKFSNTCLNEVLFGVWWVFLFLIVLAFSGRGIKFVYIDF